MKIKNLKMIGILKKILSVFTCNIIKNICLLMCCFTSLTTSAASSYVTGYFVGNMPNGTSLSFPSAGAAGAFICANINNLSNGSVRSLTQNGVNLAVSCDGENVNGDPVIGNGTASWGSVCVSADCDDNKRRKCPDPSTGNPIQTLEGVKFETHVDVSPAAGSGLTLTRYYESSDSKRASRSFGQHWRHNFEVFLEFGANAPTLPTEPYDLANCSGYYLKIDGGDYSFYGQCLPADSQDDYTKINIHHPDSGQTHFEKINNVWTADADIVDRLEDIISGGEIVGWKYSDSQNRVLTFNLEGRLISQQDLEGNTYTLNYNLTAAQGGDDNSSTLDSVVDQFSNTITFSYNNQNIVSVTDFDNRVHRYAYDQYDVDDSTKIRLQYVSVPDATVLPGSNPFNEDNPYREYHYEDNNFSNLLTGITDEKGVRYVTWTYDAERRATSSKYAPLSGSGVNLMTLDFSNESAANPYITQVNALGKTSKYYFKALHGARRIQYIEGEQHINANDSEISCEAASQYYSYDNNGFLDVVVDWEGNAIDYEHDSKGREIQRVEGLTATITSTNPLDIATTATVSTRTITTEWHPDFRLSTRITELDKITDMTYDCDNGRLLSEQVYTPASAPAYIEPVCP